MGTPAAGFSRRSAWSFVSHPLRPLCACQAEPQGLTLPKTFLGRTKVSAPTRAICNYSVRSILAAPINGEARRVGLCPSKNYKEYPEKVKGKMNSERGSEPLTVSGYSLTNGENPKNKGFLFFCGKNKKKFEKNREKPLTTPSESCNIWIDIGDSGAEKACLSRGKFRVTIKRV